MPNKYEYFSALSLHATEDLTRSPDNWMRFLETAGKIYKYPFEDQVLIHAQRPDATALAPYDFWNDHMRRYVKKGSKGIALLDESGDRPRLKYVFDISDTAARENAIPFTPWRLSSENEAAVLDALQSRSDGKAEDIVSAIRIAAKETAEDFWSAHNKYIGDIVDGSFMEEYDEAELEHLVQSLAANSVSYAVMKRCGIDADSYYDREDFARLYEFNTAQSIAFLGNAVNECSERILRQIEVTIRNYERSQEHGRNQIREERRLSDSRSEAEPGRDETPREVRQDAQGLPEEEQSGALQHPVAQREAVAASFGNGRIGEQVHGRPDAEPEGTERSDGRTEGEEPDGMDTDDEQPEITGGRDHSEGDNLQLSLFPTEEEQIQSIDEAESGSGFESLFAPSFSQDDVDNILRFGSNTERARERMVDEFSKNKTIDEKVDFLVETYRGGYGINSNGRDISVWYGEEGIYLANGSAARDVRTAKLIEWEDAANRIDELLSEGTFATNVELEESAGYARSLLAMSILYMYRDVTDDAYFPSLKELDLHGGFPDMQQRLADALKNPDFANALTDEFETFNEAYAENRDLLRFHFYRPDILQTQCEELLLPRIEYPEGRVELPEIRSFITEDEIREALSHGSGFSEGKQRIADFFEQNRNTSDRANFLKNEYGIGGRSHAVSQSPGSYEDHSGKGIKLRKRDCQDVELSWVSVVKRIDSLIKQGRYIEKMQEEPKAPEPEREQPVTGFSADLYNQIKEQHPDDLVLFQVGDFFELFGEDAVTAADELDLVMTSRRIAGTGKVEMCGFPSFLLEQYTDKLRENYDVTINGVAEGDTERRTYTLSKLKPENDLAIDDISFAREHMIPNETTFTHNGKEYLIDRVNYETGTVNYQNIDFNEELDEWLFHTEPISVVREYMEAEERESAPQVFETVDGEFFPYEVGDTVYLEDGQPFVIEEIGRFDVHLRDPSVTYPVTRAESKERFAKLIEQYPQREYRTEPVAFYPAEENKLPYDIAVETIKFNDPDPKPENFRITDFNLGEGGPKAKFRANMDAINTLKQIEFDGRSATPEEQETLSRYVGWGGLSDAFDETKENWKDEYLELYAALTPEEYEAARASTLNAHYTSPTVIKSIYDTLANLGFQSGNILEPSMGVGNFFGMLPDEMKSSKLYGVELDSITGRIAKLLYPEADITVAGFETTNRKDFFDVAVGNVPFGNYKVNDREYNKLGFSIHDYFFAKALDQVRPGGVIAFVTSRYTMDAKSPAVRRYLAERAELLGAIRLPNNAFKANAGTDVVSDILFFQKKEQPFVENPEWVFLGQNEDGFSINQYFIDRPDMMLGVPSAASTQYGKEDFTLNSKEDEDLASQLANAIQNIHGSYSPAAVTDLSEEVKDNTLPADPDVRNYSFTVVNGDIYYRENSIMVQPELSQSNKDRIKGMVEIRDCMRELIDLQMDDNSHDDEISDLQLRLNALYDSFTKKYGLINSKQNAKAFGDDNSYYLLCSLEILDENEELERKSDFFSKRTIQPHRAVTSVDTSAEALAVSISEKAKVDIEYMSELTGKTADEIETDLSGVIFRDFGTDPQRIPFNADEISAYPFVTADEYLSGNVRKKLAVVNAIEQSGEESAVKVAANKEALVNAQPADLDASEIDIRLGATWIDKEYINQFMYETFNTPPYSRYSTKVSFADCTAEWNISNKSSFGKFDVYASSVFGTERVNAYKILEDTLNLRDVRVYDTVEDPGGKEKRVLNVKETTLAQQKQQAIKDAFREWIWKDPDRRHNLVREYNERFNSTRPREYDGGHISFSGMNPEIKLREHQQNAVAHILYGGNTLLAHEVGAGKTFEMIAAAMEAKRLGLCQKSLFAVPNHLTEQWASEFLRLYPSANILVATKKDFETKNRKKFCARIATGDYDAVIIGHSQFEKIPISLERQEQQILDQLNEVMEGIEMLKYSRGERFTVKQLEKTKRQLETKLEKLQSAERKDDVVTFEQLGVDRLFVDEAHSYKNLYLYTKMRNIAGISTSEAQKSSDMYMKCRYMDEKTGGKGVVFATGTPVSNSMTELYTMMRYLQHDTLKEHGLSHFDCWAATFGETSTAIELAPEGTGYRARTRFSKFFNLPELMNIFKECADVKTQDQLNLPRPEAIYHNEVAQPTETQKALVKELSERAALVHNGSVDPSVDNMLKITSDGRKLGLDQRIINPDFEDAKGSKVNQCVDNIIRYYREGETDKLTQLVFCDISTPKSKTARKAAAKAEPGNLLSDEKNDFTVYEDIREKLIRSGIPKDEIAFIHDADTEIRKKDLFAKVRAGKVRVLFGSTSKMGAGMNVQDRLIALHDLDAPWRPGDLEQRSGRIIRQGNRNKQVHIHRYVTESTFDAYLWQTLEQKQKFISQIMTSKSPVRSCDDVDETALSFAEIKALCAGDPRIKEKMDLDIEVSKLKLMKAGHQSRQFRLEDQILKEFPVEIEQCKGYIEGFKQDLQTLREHPLPEEGFVGMTVRGDYLTDKENAGAALIDALKDAKIFESVNIGEYRGMQMYLSIEDFGKNHILTLKGRMSHRVELGKDPKGNLIRIENALNGITERLKSTETRLETLENQMADAKAELGKPFEREEELQQKSARLNELNIELNMDEHGGKEDMLPDESASAKSERPSVLSKLKEAKEKIDKFAVTKQTRRLEETL